MKKVYVGIMLFMATYLSITIMAAAPTQQSNCVFYTETVQGEGGYSVCDDAQANFRSAFQTWGLQKVGYPISQRYQRDGFVTQAFQKAIMQWRAESQSVVLVNIFDDLHDSGFDEVLLQSRQTPTQLPAGWDGEGLSFEQIVQKRQALLDERPALRTTYFASSDPLTFFGLPTSEVEDMGNHYAVRLQRAVLQEWKEDVPWAQAGEVTIANGGDIAKELGDLPTAALQTEADSDSNSGSPTPTHSNSSNSLSSDYLGSYEIEDTGFGTQVRVVVDSQAKTRTIESNALPNHETGEFPNPGNPNTISAQNKSWSFTTEPTFVGTATSVKEPGVAINGVKFDPGTAERATCESGEVHTIEAIQDVTDLGLDFNNAHVQPTGEYHYHGVSELLVDLYSSDQDLVHLAFAADGHLIYYSKSGAYQSSYRLGEGAREGTNCTYTSPGGGERITFGSDNEAGNSDYPYYWSSTSARFEADGDFYYAWYVAFGRAVNNEGLDFHGAGAVRFDTKVEGGPAGEDPERVYNYVRLVRSEVDSGPTPTVTATPTATSTTTPTAIPTSTATPTVTATPFDVGGLDTSLFFDGALAEDISIQDCTLSDGTETTCVEITIAGYPSNYDIGPFCPETTSDTAEDGGIWFDGNAVYDLTGAFILGLADLYNDSHWQLYDDDGNVNVTDTQEAFEAAAQPNVPPEYQNHCVEGRIEWLDNGEPIPTTVLIPTTATMADQTTQANGNLGVTLNGVIIANSAPVDAILSAYTIAAFDDCGGHINPFDGYHLHGARGCSEVGEAVDGETPIFAYALDGYPIHSPLSEAEEAAAGLDECNGHTTEADGYHYHAAAVEENAILSCFTGLTVGTGGPPPPPGGAPQGGTPPGSARRTSG